MRGSPLLRALVVFAAMLALAPLLWRMTHLPAAQAAGPAAGAPAGEAARVPVVLSFTTPPARVAVLHLGREVWSKDAPGAEEEAELALPWPAEGVELLFRVQWPEGARAAMRVRLTGPDGIERDQTVWRAEQVLVFQ